MVKPQPTLNFQTFFEKSPTLFLVVDRSFKIVAVSDALLQASGRTREAVVGFNIFNAFPDNPADPYANGVANLKASFERVLKNRVSDTMPLQKYDVASSGLGTPFEEKWWCPINSPVFADDGSVEFIIHQVEDATERVKMGKGRFNQTLQAADIGVWYCDLPFDKLTFDERIKNHFWIEPDQPVDIELFYQRIHPEDREITRSIIEKSIREHTPCEIEYRTVNPKTGAIHWIRSIANTTYLADGTPIRFDGVALNITDRKEAAAALQESELRFRTLSNSIPQLAWMADETGYLFWYNQRWYDYTGTTFEQMQGWGWTSVHDPKHVDRVIKSFTHSLEVGEAWEDTFPLRSKTGEWRWFLSRAEPMRDETGKVIRWFGSNTDIEEQRRNREAGSFLSEASLVLASSLNYVDTFQAVARLAVPRLADWCRIDVIEEGGPRAIAVAHSDPEMIKLAEELSKNYPPDWNALTGAANVIRTGNSELYPEISDQLLAASARDEDHLKIIRALNIRSALIVPIQARGKTLGALTLISTQPNRRFTQFDLETAQELGRRAGIAVDNAKLFEQAHAAIRVRDEFLSIASHELKTPITSLKLQAQMNKRRLAMGDPLILEKRSVAKLIETTDRQTDRLTKLVEDMLDISRINHGKLSIQPEDVDLGLLVRDVVDRFDEQLKLVGCRYTLHIESSIIGKWDRYRIEQVVINLLTNAMKYGAEKPIEISVLGQNEFAIIRIRDYGMGIAKENLDRIFNRFERAITAKNISGLGLGLYISKQIVEAHGGEIHAEGELGAGSVFTVRLPFHPTKTASIA